MRRMRDEEVEEGKREEEDGAEVVAEAAEVFQPAEDAEGGASGGDCDGEEGGASGFNRRNRR